MRIAKQYPETDFIVWLDQTQMQPEDIKALQHILDQAEVKNISIQDLNEIPLYQTEPVFRDRSYDDPSKFNLIWQQVDLARVIVLDHVLKTSDAKSIFYSDIDIDDPQLNKAQEIIDKHGAVFAITNRNGTKDVPYLENQFMGFAPSRHRDLQDNLLKRTTEDVNTGKNGWPALCGFFHDLNFSKADTTITTSEALPPDEGSTLYNLTTTSGIPKTQFKIEQIDLSAIGELDLSKLDF